MTRKLLYLTALGKAFRLDAVFERNLNIVIMKLDCLANLEILGSEYTVNKEIYLY